MFDYKEYETIAKEELTRRGVNLGVVDLPLGWWLLLAGYLDAVEALHPAYSGNKVTQAKVKFDVVRIYFETGGVGLKAQEDVNNLEWLLNYECHHTCKTCGVFVPRQKEHDYTCSNCKHENPNNKYPHFTLKMS